MIEFHQFTLANGLRVIVHEDHSVAKAAVDVVYRVGARDEQEHRTGLAHLFEHLMFGGSKHIPDFDTHVQRAGGENNAFTNNDITNYYITLPAAQLDTALWLESDRMLALDFSQRSLDVQKSVVIEEFKQRYLNQPYGDAYLHLRPLVYTTHPYRWMTIGERIEHIEAVTLDEIQAFFYAHYAPNNATLVVAGDVTRAQVEDAAERWFGSIPRRVLASKDYPAEPPQNAPRAHTVTGPVPHAAVYRAYHAPARTDADFHAVDLLCDVLSSGKAARLYQALVKGNPGNGTAQHSDPRRVVASSVSAFTWGLYGPGMVSVNGQVADGVSPEAYLEQLDAALAALDSLVPEELQRVQAKAESADAFEKTEIAQRAMALAIYDSIGDPQLINTELQRYRAVTVDDVHQARARWFTPAQSSTLTYLPKT